MPASRSRRKRRSRTLAILPTIIAFSLAAVAIGFVAFAVLPAGADKSDRQQELGTVIAAPTVQEVSFVENTPTPRSPAGESTSIADGIELTPTAPPAALNVKVEPTPTVRVIHRPQLAPTETTVATTTTTVVSRLLPTSTVGQADFPALPTQTQFVPPAPPGKTPSATVTASPSSTPAAMPTQTQVSQPRKTATPRTIPSSTNTPASTPTPVIEPVTNTATPFRPKRRHARRNRP